MFERYTYLSLTLLFCVPALVLLWTRTEFRSLLRRDLGAIAAVTAAITLYGSLTWPVAMRWGCWSYDESRLTGYRLFGWVWLEDAVWWGLVSFLCASFVALSVRYEERGVDVVAREVRGLWGAFRCAFAGLRVAGTERNLTIHASAATAVVLAGWLFGLTALEWALATLAIAGVAAAELLNSAIERLAPAEFSESVRAAKDTAASGVLAMALAAVVAGAVIFLPRLLR